MTIPTPSTSYSVQYAWAGPPRQPTFWFSSTEVKHVIIGLVLVSAVGLSLQRSLRIIGIYNFRLVLLAVALFTLGFILHELAHKFSAQSHGLWAEFRLSTLGVLITTLSVFSPIKFIAPGMVLIAGTAGLDVVGQVALAGPLTNLIMAFLAMLTAFAIPAEALHHVLALGCWVNSYMALFNLIPFGDFDGLKVFKWNKVVWALIVGLAIALLFYSSQFVFPES